MAVRMIDHYLQVLATGRMGAATHVARRESG